MLKNLFFLVTLVSAISARAQAPEEGLPPELANPSEVSAPPATSETPNVPAAATVPMTAGPPALTFAPPQNQLDTVSKRDPFFITGITEEKSKNGSTYSAPVIEVRDPLLKSDVQDFEIVGIMWEVNKPKAIIRDRDNQNHLILKGTRIGRNNGFVAAIREGEIVVMETIEDENGKPVKRPKVMAFKRNR